MPEEFWCGILWGTTLCLQEVFPTADVTETKVDAQFLVRAYGTEQKSTAS